MDCNKFLKDAYRKQFESYYETILTDEQLEIYMNFFLGKEMDMDKVANVCGIPFKESFSTRDSFRRQFNFIYDFEPTDEQLDMFISFMLGVVTNIDKVIEICDNKQSYSRPGCSQPIR